MNGKITIVCILGVLMLVTISFASAVNTDKINVDKKESPLYSIRTKSAIRAKINKIIDSIKTKFLGERIFFVPFYRLIKIDETFMSKPPFSEKPLCTDSPGYESCAPPCFRQ